MRQGGPRAIASILFIMAAVSFFAMLDLFDADETAYAVVALMVSLILLLGGIGAVMWGRRRARMAGHRYTPPFMESDGRRVDELYPEDRLHDRGESIPTSHKVSYYRSYHGITPEDYEQMFGTIQLPKGKPDQLH